MQKISIQSENKSFCLNISLEHITSEDEIKLNSMAILILAHENDFSVICMEEDSPKIEGFPTFNWLVRTGEDLAKRLSEDSFLDW